MDCSSGVGTGVQPASRPAASGRRLARVVALAATSLIAAALVAGCTPMGPAAASTHDVPAATPGAPGERQTAYDPPRAAPPLRLTDQQGQPFDLASLRGTPVVVEFGYTHCPDICPATLADVRDALKLVARPVRLVFVTVDPARDTAAALAQYLRFYDPSFIGLTGTEEQIRAAADAWGVSYQRLPSTGAAGYAMAHTAEIFLVDPAGQLRHHVFFGAGPVFIAQKLTEIAP